MLTMIKLQLIQIWVKRKILDSESINEVVINYVQNVQLKRLTLHYSEIKGGGGEQKGCLLHPHSM